MSLAAPPHTRSTLSISMLLVTLASGVLDHWVLSDEELRKQPRLQMLVWFSPVRNLRKLVLSASDADELTCVHGIRFLTMAWIIAGHTLEWNNLNTISKVLFVCLCWPCKCCYFLINILLACAFN